MDVSQRILFIDICEMLEKIKNTEELKQKEKLLIRYITSFRKFSEEIREENGDKCKSSFYAVMRCLVPSIDTARDCYFLRASSLGKIYQKILQLPDNSVDTKKLLSSSIAGFRGDYADIVYTVLRSRVTNVPSEKTLFDIHEALDELSMSTKAESEGVLRNLVESISAVEHKWLIRLILQRMSLGMSDDKILNLLDNRASMLYNKCSNLEKVCIAVEHGEDLENIDLVAPFNFIHPMLSDRLDVHDLYDLMGADTVYAEIKMDGERFQLHKSGEKFKYLSRNGKDYTKFFGKNKKEGSFTPRCACLLDHMEQIILDGEMMVWNNDLGYFSVKGEKVDAKHLRGSGPLRVCFVVYDLLYLNGKDLLDLCYVDRMKMLDSIFKEVKGVLVRSKYTEICTLQHFQEYFNAALDASEEGVVVKLSRSLYKPGFRTGGWYKIKPDYISGLISDMDVLIMGGYYNPSNEYVGSYLVGVYEGDQTEGTVHCMGTLASGLTKQKRIQLNEALEQFWKKGFPSSSLNFGNLRPDVWIEPQDSIVLQIKATELAQASSFATPFTVRFPRIEKVRSDKPWYESMSLAEYNKLCGGERGVKKIHHRGLRIDDLKPAKPKTPKGPTIKQMYCPPLDASTIPRETSLLKHLIFCVLSGVKKTKDGTPLTEHAIKETIIRHGGKVVENPSEGHTVCIVGDMTCRAKEVIETGLYNAVSYTWLHKVVKIMGLDMRPRDLVYVTKKMQDQINKLYDEFGDSYIEPTGFNELVRLCNDIDKNGHELPILSDESEALLEQEIFDPEPNPNYLRGLSGCFYSQNPERELSHESLMARYSFQWYGGRCCEPDETTTRIDYILVDPHRLDLFELEMWFISNFKKHEENVPILSIKWVMDCEQAGNRLPLADYIIQFRLDIERGNTAIDWNLHSTEVEEKMII